MSAAPTRIANVGLYRKLLRAAQGFAQYNVRDYAVRYIRDDFRAAASFSGQEALDAFKGGMTQLEMLTRQSTISKMFPQDRHVMEEEDGSRPTATKRERQGSRFDEHGPKI
jgi:hypothetical protein